MPEISLLGIDYDKNFTTNPYLHKLARESKTRAALIHRLSFGMPPHLLGIFANGLLMGKILASAPASIPIRIQPEDRNSITVTEDINKSIKAAAKSITRTKLSDKVRTETVLAKAGLCCLNEAVAPALAALVWTSKQNMNPLGVSLFAEKEHKSDTCVADRTRSAESSNISLPVPGFPTLPSNLMAKVWNTVPGLVSRRLKLLMNSNHSPENGPKQSLDD